MYLFLLIIVWIAILVHESIFRTDMVRTMSFHILKVKTRLDLGRRGNDDKDMIEIGLAIHRSSFGY